MEHVDSAAVIVIKRGQKATKEQLASGTRKYQYWKRSGFDRYELKTKVKGKEMKTWFHVCVRCKNQKGKRGKYGRNPLPEGEGTNLKQVENFQAKAQCRTIYFKNVRNGKFSGIDFSCARNTSTYCTVNRATSEYAEFAGS